MVAGDAKFWIAEWFSYGLEPIGAVGDPPSGHACGDRCQKRPPKWKREVGDQAERGESEPENFALHEASLPEKLLWHQLHRILCLDEKRRKKKRPGTGPGRVKRVCCRN
jgi:hypothetical protein